MLHGSPLEFFFLCCIHGTVVNYRRINLTIPLEIKTSFLCVIMKFCMSKKQFTIEIDNVFVDLNQIHH